MSHNTTIGPAFPTGDDYKTEIARRMWCAVVERVTDDDADVAEIRATDPNVTTEEIRSCK